MLLCILSEVFGVTYIRCRWGERRGWWNRASFTLKFCVSPRAAFNESVHTSYQSYGLTDMISLSRVPDLPSLLSAWKACAADIFIGIALWFSQLNWSEQLLSFFLWNFCFIRWFTFLFSNTYLFKNRSFFFNSLCFFFVWTLKFCSFSLIWLLGLPCVAEDRLYSSLDFTSRKIGFFDFEWITRNIFESKRGWNFSFFSPRFKILRNSISRPPCTGPESQERKKFVLDLKKLVLKAEL